jgi:KDO2-lipid IV(A) lauroyltransferase
MGFGMTYIAKAEAALLRAVLTLARAIPPETASNIGGAIARLIGPMLPVSRVARSNLRAALPDLTPAQIRTIIRGVWDNLGRTAAELPHLSRLKHKSGPGPGWEISDPSLVEAVAGSGRPAVFVTGHIGNWEMLAVAATAYGIQLSGMYRAAGNPYIDRIITELRTEATGATVPMFPKGAAGARRAAGHLARGGFLGLLVDQKLNEGLSARFFGLPAMTTTAPAVFALRYRCPIIPIHVQRLAPARLRVMIEPPLPLPDTGDRAADIATLTQQINDILERWVRANPASWLWLHRRWPKDIVHCNNP